MGIDCNVKEEQGRRKGGQGEREDLNLSFGVGSDYTLKVIGVLSGNHSPSYDHKMWTHF